MTTPKEAPVMELSESESWARLSGVTLGRLAISVAGQPDIFPVNFVVQRKTILIRTAEGTKLTAAVINQRVAFEADEHNVEAGWSVIVKGLARVLSGSDEIADAERAQVLPWTATPKQRFIRIVATEISGRHFQFGAEPDYLLDFG
jgi:nitroimidazol reductase NimA-like FMN-containing flavoprotein (pyridoxamine 5'-phosphate oxidase superfamily)